MANQVRRDRTQRLFTHTLSNTMLLMILAYLISNVIVIQSCKNRHLLNQEGPICSIAEVFEPLRHVIPVIYRPVEVIESHGDQGRANLVVAAYGFSWGSFLIFGALMIAVAVVRIRLLSDQDRRIYLDWCARENRSFEGDKKHAERGELGIRIILCLTVVAFVWAFWGFFDFDTPSYIGNMVQERDRDLYQPAVFLSGIQLFLMVLISRQIMRHLLKTAAL